MKKQLKQKLYVLYIAKPELLEKYPTRYRRDTEKYPQLQLNLYGQDDRVIIISDPDKDVYDRTDICLEDDFFYKYPVDTMSITMNPDDDFVRLAIEKDLGLSIGDMADSDLDVTDSIT